MDEDVDIVGNDPPISSYLPVELEKDAAHRGSKCSSSTSSSSDSGSSSSGLFLLPCLLANASFMLSHCFIAQLNFLNSSCCFSLLYVWRLKFSFVTVCFPIIVANDFFDGYYLSRWKLDGNFYRFLDNMMLCFYLTPILRGSE